MDLASGFGLAPALFLILPFILIGSSYQRWGQLASLRYWLATVGRDNPPLRYAISSHFEYYFIGSYSSINNFSTSQKSSELELLEFDWNIELIPSSFSSSSQYQQGLWHFNSNPKSIFPCRIFWILSSLSYCESLLSWFTLLMRAQATSDYSTSDAFLMVLVALIVGQYLLLSFCSSNARVPFYLIACLSMCWQNLTSYALPGFWCIPSNPGYLV